MSARKRILIVGGVAGGASCATRARRLDETAEIILFDRGPHVSFANCGLPYYVGNVIKDEAHLLVASAELFRQRAYYAARALTQHGCTARLLPGGYQTYLALTGSGALTG